STTDEDKNLSIVISYWLEWMQKLKMDDDTGIYGFQDVDETKLDDFEKGKLAYHRGQFDQAVSFIERDLSKRGESESKLFWLAMCHIRRGEAVNCLARLIDAPGSAGFPNANDHSAHHAGNAKADSSSNAFSASNDHSDQGAHSQMCAL